MSINMKLGFGLMRLPEKDGNVDLEHVNKMVDLYMERGFGYFDTAYVYHNGLSEGILKTCVADRKPRDSYMVATKMPIYSIKEEGDAEKFFATQMERTGLDYFDYYMLHALGKGTYEGANKQFGVWDFLQRMKAEGKCRRIGFSFHDKPEVLDTILSEMPNVDFVMLQINYLDWDCPNVRAREMYEIVRARGIDVLVMEPVRGGSLAAFTGEIRDMMVAANPNVSIASWAIRFANSLPGVIGLLSGMSNEEQMMDNLNTMTELPTLTDDEFAMLAKIADIIRATPTIGCTSCKYCLEYCPEKIEIHRVISALNHNSKYGSLSGFHNPQPLMESAAKCIACGQCEPPCPQVIDIRGAMSKAGELVK